MAKATKRNLYRAGEPVEYGVIWGTVHTVMAEVAIVGDPTQMIGMTASSRAICGKRVRVYPRAYMAQSAIDYPRSTRTCETCRELAPEVAGAHIEAVPA